MNDNREDRVRQRAHEIWLREGQPDGQGGRHWIEAEGEIDAEDKAKKPKKVAAAKTPAKPAAKAPSKPAAKAPAKKPAKKA